MAQSPKLFRRYLWLINVVQRAGRISREGINLKWRYSVLNEDHEQEIPVRTFIRHREAIESLFGVKIVCDKHSNRYYISNPDLFVDGEMERQVLESVSTDEGLRESNVEVECVVITVDEDYAPRIRHNPFSPTQREIAPTIYADGSVDATFEMMVKPTSDFMMELYKYGCSLEVISPQWVRETLSNWAFAHNELYHPSLKD